MHILRLTYVYREFLALITTTIFSLFLFFSNTSNFVHEVKGDIADIFEVVMKPQRWYKDILTTKQEKYILIEEVAQLQLMNSKLLRYMDENIHLRDMLDFKSEGNLKLIPARVINHQMSASKQSFFIEVGSEDGVYYNMAVIDMNGLLGKTISIGKSASEVQMITDKNFRVSVRVGEDRTLGIFHPTDGTYGVLEGVQKSLHIEEGTLVYTSGISDIYPPDIPLAKVIASELYESRPYQFVIVELTADINELEYIFVITDHNEE